MPKGKIGQLSRSSHSSRARAAQAEKLGTLRGKERGANVKGSSFAKGLDIIESEALKKARKRRK